MGKTSSVDLTPDSANGPASAPGANISTSGIQFTSSYVAGAHKGVRLQAHRASGPGSKTSAPVSWLDFVQLLASDAGFRTDFNAKLAEMKLLDQELQSPAISGHTAAQKPFECVVLDATGKTPTASRTEFDTLFSRSISAESTVVRFPGVGRDATLLVPAPDKGIRDGTYGSLASFARGARPEQQQQLWRAVGEEMLQQLKAQPSQPVWLNTDCRGVPWFHFRLDVSSKHVKNIKWADDKPASEVLVKHPRSMGREQVKEESWSHKRNECAPSSL